MHSAVFREAPAGVQAATTSGDNGFDSEAQAGCNVKCGIQSSVTIQTDDPSCGNAIPGSKMSTKHDLFSLESHCRDRPVRARASIERQIH